MTAQTEDNLTISLNVISRPHDGPEMALRQVLLGKDPLVLIEVDMDASTEEEMVLNVDATGFAEDPESLSSMLRVIADGIDRGIKAGHFQQEPAEDEESAADD